MPELIAQAAESQHRWRRHLEEHRAVAIGRSAAWSVPWDPHISRTHVEVVWDGRRLKVQRQPDARNAVFVQGEPRDSFELAVGEHFVIGSTSFHLVDEQLEVTEDLPRPVSEQSFRLDQLQQLRFRAAEQRIDALTRLPDLVEGITGDTELCNRLVSLLLDGIPGATAAAVIACHTGDDGGAASPFSVLHWDERSLGTGRRFRPSSRLVRRAVETGESVLHMWRSGTASSAFTMAEGVDWALCMPVRGAADTWVLYLEGGPDPRQADNHGSLSLSDDLKFTELVAHMVSQVRSARHWERRHARLRPFFSPVVLEALAGGGDQLMPSQCEAAVLFCDLRGFSEKSEDSSDDLFGLLDRISRVLGVVTRQILAHGGVVGDFHGDAVMGFWGWPLRDPEAIGQACRAALAIQQTLQESASRSSDLANFQAGIGLAAGPAVAGPIGTDDQVKVTAFGPVVNRAARLESATKKLRASILLDATAADWVRDRCRESDEFRLRPVAQVHLPGLKSPERVHQLLPAERIDPTLNDQQLAAYAEAWDAFERGDWDTAYRRLHEVPAEDRVKDFLTAHIARHGRVPPPDWKGVVRLDDL